MISHDSPKPTSTAPQDEAEHWRRVIAFYDNCWSDFVGLWANTDNLALHWGYWDEHTRTHSDSLLNLNREMARLANVGSGDRVLDAGCGFGGATFWLAEQCSADVVGINISEVQLARARKLAMRRGLADSVRLEHGDMLCTGHPDESYDVVWAQESVAYSPDQRQFLGESFRLLRPGGRLVLEDRFRTSNSLAREDEQQLQRFRESSFMPMIPTGNDFVEWARAAGFEEARLIDIMEACAPSCRRFRMQTNFTYPIAKLLRRIGLRSAEQLSFLEGLVCEQELQQRGVLLLAIFVATKPGRPGEAALAD